MKRAFFLFLIAIFIASCGEGPMGKSPITNPGQESDGDTGGLFGDQPGASDEGIPIEGESSDPAGNKEPPPPPPKVIKPVEITKAGGDLGTCVIGKACKKTISAKGGSGEYVWTLVEGALPKGLEFADQTAQKIKIKKIEGQEIDEVGEFTFTLKVEDAADPTRSAERKFTLRIEENIAMVLYTMAEDDSGQKKWVVVSEKDENGNAIPVTVPPKGILLVEVIGHAPSYKWSINGQEITCNDQTCTGTKDGLTLYKDTNLSPPEPHPEHFAYMILKAEEDFIGIELKDVVIAAAQDYGDPVSKTIQSITFEQEPCKIQMTLGDDEEMSAKRGEKVVVNFSVVGGKAPYTWVINRAIFKPASGGLETKEHLNSPNGGSNAQTAEEQTPDDVAMYTVEEQIPDDAAVTDTYQLAAVVKDSCAAPNEASKTVTIHVECRIAAVDHVEFNAHYSGGHNDTDVCDETTAGFGLRLKDDTEIGSTGNIHIDTNDDDIIDDLSPTYVMALDSTYCLEDIGKFRWWIDGDACWEYPEVFVDTVLVVVDKFYAGWNGSIGEDDLGDWDDWVRDFNFVCDETGELWCKENPRPGYEDWGT